MPISAVTDKRHAGVLRAERKCSGCINSLGTVRIKRYCVSAPVLDVEFKTAA